MIMDPLRLCPGCFSAERTAGVCSTCSYDGSVSLHSYSLAPYTVLREKYYIGRVLGRPGGFGITYLALDTSLSTLVAIKEYCPRDLAGRSNDGSSIQPLDAADTENYQKGLEQFIEEARTLAKFSHPNIIGVRDVFRANNSAYMVMDYHSGGTLQEYVYQHGGKLAADVALPLLRQALHGLQEVHERGLLHRDIKPQNLYHASESGRILLLDFGAARSVRSFDGRTVTVIFAPDFAAPEQQMERGELGPCTDIYGIGATLFYLLTGNVLPPVLQRIHRPTVEVVQTVAPHIPGPIAELIARCVEIEAPKRFQTVEQLSAALDYVTNTDAVHSLASPTTGNTRPDPTVNQGNVNSKPGESSKSASSDSRRPVQATPQGSTVTLGSKQRRLFVSIFAGLFLVVSISIVWLLMSPGDETGTTVEVTQGPAVTTSTINEPPATGSFGAGKERQQPAQEGTKPKSPSTSTPPRTSIPDKRKAFPYSRSRFVEMVMDHDLAFDRNTHSESESGVRIILGKDATIRFKKYSQWREDIPGLGSFTNRELDEALQQLFFGQ